MLSDVCITVIKLLFLAKIHFFFVFIAFGAWFLVSWLCFMYRWSNLSTFAGEAACLAPFPPFGLKKKMQAGTDYRTSLHVFL